MRGRVGGRDRGGPQQTSWYYIMSVPAKLDYLTLWRLQLCRTNCGKQHVPCARMTHTDRETVPTFRPWRRTPWHQVSASISTKRSCCGWVPRTNMNTSIRNSNTAAADGQAATTATATATAATARGDWRAQRGHHHHRPEPTGGWPAHTPQPDWPEMLGGTYKWMQRLARFPL